MQTNRKGVVSKEATVKGEGTGFQTSTSKGPFIHKPTGEIGTSQKFPLYKKKEGGNN